MKYLKSLTLGLVLTGASALAQSAPSVLVVNRSSQYLTQMRAIGLPLADARPGVQIWIYLQGQPEVTRFLVRIEVGKETRSLLVERQGDNALALFEGIDAPGPISYTVYPLLAPSAGAQ